MSTVPPTGKTGDGSVCAAGQCEFCGCTFRRPSDVLRHRCAAMQQAEDDAPRCEGQPKGEPTCDEKINYWMGRWREACEQLEEMRAELRSVEPVLVAADRVREAYEAMTEGRDIGRLADWERPS